MSMFFYAIDVPPQLLDILRNVASQLFIDDCSLITVC